MAVDNKGLQFLQAFFKDKDDGYLIDVGAHDGVKTGSMTRFLMERGWAGMLIEPLPEAFRQLESAYRGNHKAVTLSVACSNKVGVINLYPFRGVSTVEPEWRDACAGYWKHVQYGPPLVVPKRTLKGLLREHGGPSKVDLLQVDAEGHDLKVLQGMDWERKPSVVCAESLDMRHRDRRKRNGCWEPAPEMVEYMRGVGYRCARLTRGGNVFFLREDQA